ncbi:urea carboxylase [Halovibrio salipaludis]|uniref:Urea carboxylase n=1 Tax=Halovibrio salipaludis TaxID=2032626 RepID=A0A2A2F6R4_9GAMM|nr:urea amidolyase associated protein UAAP1 [Halovibrio salipaludis]PAU80510.1 urea carboxylase [Halovibrio salipaludis]
MSRLLYDYTLPGGHHWSFRMRRNTGLRLTDVEGGGNLALLVFNPEMLMERYNAPDTMKAQETFRLTQGHCLYSDMGRCIASIVEDDFGGHDSACGTLARGACYERFGRWSFQEYMNEWCLSGEESFLTELTKYGLGERDLHANLNLFSRVETDDAGNMRYVDSHNRPGASVTLRFDMDALVIAATSPHPLNPATKYPKKPIQVEFLKTDPVTPDDECVNAHATSRRAMENTRLYYLDDPVRLTDAGGA